jgi:hypothetical protein
MIHTASATTTRVARSTRGIRAAPPIAIWQSQKTCEGLFGFDVLPDLSGRSRKGVRGGSSGPPSSKAQAQSGKRAGGGRRPGA